MNAPASPCSISLTRDVIDPDELTRFVNVPQAGAVLLFMGTVRELTNGRRTVALDYEAYPEMAIPKMQELAQEAMAKWPILKLAMTHRLGRLELGDVSVGIAVSCPHRAEAFASGQYLIDELKIRIPIWKKENWDDGSTAWIHPGTESAPSRQPPPTSPGVNLEK